MKLRLAALVAAAVFAACSPEVPCDEAECATGDAGADAGNLPDAGSSSDGGDDEDAGVDAGVSCTALECGPRASCVDHGDGPECVCEAGFEADAGQCECGVDPAPAHGACERRSCSVEDGWLTEPDPAQDGASCDDGNLCTHTDLCAAGDCVGTSYFCDDARACTNDVCDGVGGCTHPIRSGFCLIDDACYADEAPNAGNSCLACDAVANATAWSAANEGQSCNDGNACTHSDTCMAGTCAATAYSCNDALACTSDICDGSGGCAYTVNNGFCAIAQACYPDGAVNPSSPCLRCNAAVNSLDWSPAEDGQSCNDGNACTHSDACMAGICGGSSYSCNDALACTADACDGAGGCTFTVNNGFCAISQACYATGTINPGSPCLWCDPAVNPVEWSSVPNGQVCNDHTPCTHSDACMAGICGGSPYSCNDALACTADACDGAGGCTFTVNNGFCAISQACYANGALNPGNACLRCSSAENATDWSPVPNCG